MKIETAEKPFRRFAAAVADGDRHSFITVDIQGIQSHGNARPELIAEALRQIAAKIEADE